MQRCQSNNAKTIKILVINSSFLPNYFDGLTKLSSQLHPIEFLNILARRLSVYVLNILIYIKYLNIYNLNIYILSNIVMHHK